MSRSLRARVAALAEEQDDRGRISFQRTAARSIRDAAGLCAVLEVLAPADAGHVLEAIAEHGAWENIDEHDDLTRHVLGLGFRVGCSQHRGPLAVPDVIADKLRAGVWWPWSHVCAGCGYQLPGNRVVGRMPEGAIPAGVNECALCAGGFDDGSTYRRTHGERPPRLVQPDEAFERASDDFKNYVIQREGPERVARWWPTLAQIRVTPAGS